MPLNNQISLAILKDILLFKDAPKICFQNIVGDDMDAEYPTILRRYLSTFIDAWFIIACLIFVPYVIGDEENTLYVRIIIAAIMLFVYEPLFTSKLCTLGQKITGIRVRNRINYQQLAFPLALLRVVIKWLFGFISFFSIVFSEEKRAIHDFVSGSIVIFTRGT
jgi:uncharacterized RDD family membrane protein YckC